MRNPLNIVDSNKTNFNHIYSDSFHNEHFSSKPYQESESKNNQISLYQQELNDYERRKKRGYTTGNRPLGNFFHFNYSDEINFTPEKKLYSDKNVGGSDFNISLIRTKKESDLHYVGFENKYGDNSCCINVFLHFFYQFPSVNEFLIKLYKNKKDNFIINEKDDEDSFYFLLGKTLFEYQTILSDSDNKGITILHTTELRKYLQKISGKIYKLDAIGDPVELLTFILDKLNIYNKSEIHKDFFINLIEEIKCSENCENVKKNKYDENNFIYQIYMNDIIPKLKFMDFQNFSHQLFEFSKIYSLIDDKTCQKCGKKKKHILKYIGPECPQYLLINCVWENRKPDLSNVLKFLYTLTLEGTLNNLFECENIKDFPFYNLSGMILYSGALCHYINVIYNIQKNIFVLYNDDKIKELANIHDVYLEITAEQIKKNSEAFYYPVLLIYYKEIIFDNMETRKLNQYSYKKFAHLEKECEKAKKINLPLTEEQKKKNYLELERAQFRKLSADPTYSNNMEIEDSFRYYKENNININVHNSNDISETRKRDKNNNMDIEEDKIRIFGFENDNDNDSQEKDNKYNYHVRNNKKYGTDIKNNKYKSIGDIDFFRNII